MKQTIQIGKRIIQTDFGFIAILILLCLTSCFALYNSFNLISVGSGVFYLNRQIMWYAVSFAIMAVICHFKNRALFKHIDLIYKILLYILIYHVISRFCDKLFGHSLPLAGNINGAYSWLSIPFFGSFQASEFMKVVLIIKTSMTISHFQKTHPEPTYKDDFRMFAEIIRWCFLPLLLILLQPDTGVCMLIGFTLLILIMCSGIRRQYIITILSLIAAVIALFFLLYFYYPSALSAVTSQYQLNRIEAWLHPDDYILGSSNQLYTALLSLGSAGLTGHGLQANIIAIPEAHTDFIFAAFGQCFGLVGTVFILIVCALLDLYLCKMAYNTRKKTDRLIIIGTIAMLFYQQAQNIGMIVGLVPITGITLPLISYGGSSTLSYFILFGLILNMSPVSRTSVRLKNPVKEIQKRIQRLQKKNRSAVRSVQPETKTRKSSGFKKSFVRSRQPENKNRKKRHFKNPFRKRKSENVQNEPVQENIKHYLFEDMDAFFSDDDSVLRKNEISSTEFSAADYSDSVHDQNSSADEL